ncbi:hypothetical protein Taro_049790, partial [Colocasia esculenta]|nr:hypothetical protein [Colocasia esculenta]
MIIVATHLPDATCLSWLPYPSPWDRNRLGGHDNIWFTSGVFHSRGWRVGVCPRTGLPLGPSGREHGSQLCCFCWWLPRQFSFAQCLALEGSSARQVVIVTWDPQPHASVSEGVAPGGRRAQVSEVVEVLFRCGPASPSHCLALRWFRSRIGRSSVGPQLGRAAVVCGCVLCCDSLASLYQGGNSQESTVGELEEWAMCPPHSCMWRWLVCSCVTVFLTLFSRLGTQLLFRLPFLGTVCGGTGVCSSLTSWRVRGAGWFCLWALDLVEFLLLWLVRDWLSLLSLVREADPPTLFRSVGGGVIFGVPGGGPGGRVVTVVASFPAGSECELQESVAAVAGCACCERGCGFARAAVRFVLGLHVLVGVSRRLREPMCGMAFTGAGLWSAEPVEGVLALLAVPLLFGFGVFARARQMLISSLLVLVEVRFPQNCVVLVSGCCGVALWVEAYRLAPAFWCSFLELFVVVLVSVVWLVAAVVPSRLRCIAWLPCILVRFPRTVGCCPGENGALVVVVDVLREPVCVASADFYVLSVGRLFGLCSGDVFPEWLLAPWVEVLPKLLCVSSIKGGGLLCAFFLCFPWVARGGGVGMAVGAVFRTVVIFVAKGSVPCVLFSVRQHWFSIVWLACASIVLEWCLVLCASKSQYGGYVLKAVGSLLVLLVWVSGGESLSVGLELFQAVGAVVYYTLSVFLSLLRALCLEGWGRKRVRSVVVPGFGLGPSEVDVSSSTSAVVSFPVQFADVLSCLDLTTSDVSLGFVSVRVLVERLLFWTAWSVEGSVAWFLAVSVFLVGLVRAAPVELSTSACVLYAVVVHPAPNCCFGNHSLVPSVVAPECGRACGETVLLTWLLGVSRGDTWLFLPNLVEVWDVGACVVRLWSQVIAPVFLVLSPTLVVGHGIFSVPLLFLTALA